VQDFYVTIVKCFQGNLCLTEYLKVIVLVIVPSNLELNILLSKIMLNRLAF
jgi:hypothetical protein